METPLNSNKKELELAILEARLEGFSISYIVDLLGKSQSFIRQVLAKFKPQLEEHQKLLNDNLEDFSHREAQMRELATETILDALNGKFGTDKTFDAAKTVYKTQKFESGVRDATTAFREMFVSKAGD